MFGQLRHDKGIGDLVEAVRRVPDLHLLIGGQDTGGLSAVADLLATPELQGRVIIREGFLSMAEAAKLYAATDTVTLPYKMASQSGVLLLSYGFERPVVVYPVGGLPRQWWKARPAGSASGRTWLRSPTRSRTRSMSAPRSARGVGSRGPGSRTSVIPGRKLRG